MKKVFTILFISLIGFFVLYSGGAKEEFPEDFTLSVVALNGPTGIGMIHLFEDRPKLAENINVDYRVALAPKVLMGDLAKGEIDIAVLPANMPALLYSKNLPYKVAAVTGFGVLYVVSRDTSITSLKDLNGKTIYNAAKGATPDFLSRFLLKGEDIDSEKDLYMDFSYSHADLAKAMIGGLVDTAILPEPFVTMVTENSDAEVVLDLQEIWMKQQSSKDSYPMSTLVIRADILENYPVLVRDFLNVYEKSINAVNNNPSEAADLVPMHGFTMSSVVTEKAIPRINLKFVRGEDSRQVLSEYYSILFEMDPKILGGALPGSDLYYIEK